MRVEASTIIAAPRERVWSALVAWEDQPRWMVDAAGVRVIEEPREGVGVRLSVPTRVFGMRAFTDILEVTAWEPPARLVIAHRRLVEGDGTWTLIERDLATRFSWAEEIRVPLPILGELALGAYRPILERMMTRSLERFRVMVESGAGD